MRSLLAAQAMLEWSKEDMAGLSYLSKCSGCLWPPIVCSNSCSHEFVMSCPIKIPTKPENKHFPIPPLETSTWLSGCHLCEDAEYLDRIYPSAPKFPSATPPQPPVVFQPGDSIFSSHHLDSWPIAKKVAQNLPCLHLCALCPQVVTTEGCQQKLSHL